MPEQEQLHKETAITRAWRLGGPMSITQRKDAKALFLAYLKDDQNVTLACAHAGITRKTAYVWRENDSTFADGWEDAVERTRDIARSSIYQRGILGWSEPMVSVGQIVYEYLLDLDENGMQKVDNKGKPLMRRGNPLMQHKWSDTLAIAYARANLPEYKEKQQIDLNTQITTIAEQAKDGLLTDLAASMNHEDQEQTDTEA